MNKQPEKFAPKDFCLLIYAAFAVLLFAFGAHAADGDLDTSFDGDGKVFTDFGSLNEGAVDAVLQPDGKIVLVGITDSGSTNKIALARYNADGSLDATFGTGGKVINGDGGTTGQATAAALQSDGKIVVTLSTAGGKVARFNANGSLDTTFGTNGFASIPATNNVQASALRDVFVQPDGKILVCGSGFKTPPFAFGFGLFRLNQNGSLDTAFGANGYVITDFTGSSQPEARGIAVRADGKIALGGVAFSESGPAVTKLLVALYNADGSLDQTFGAGGKVITDSSENSTIESIVFQTDGKLVTGGSTSNGNDGTRGLLRRYTATGAPDAAFGTNGAVIVRLNNGATKINDIALQTDGKIVGFGQAFDLPSLVLSIAVVRYLPSGTIDASFGRNGFVTTFFTNLSGDNDEAFAGFIQPDGKIVAAGNEKSGTNAQSGGSFNFAVVRYLNTPGSPTVVNPALKIADFDGDGKADASVFRNGTWYVNRSAQGFLAIQFGIASDKPAPADYDGDGKTDIAVWREAVDNEKAYFFIINSSTNTVRVDQFGNTGDRLTVGDWDGDGKADLAVYRNAAAGAQSYFYYKPSTQAAVKFISIPWGTTGDLPARGDFDGDGKFDAAVFRPATGTWIIAQSSNAQAVYRQFGVSSDKLVPADYDGDGRTDTAVFRSGTWIIFSSATNQVRYQQWGLSTDIPVTADYDGDGKADVAVYRDGTYFILQSSNSQIAYLYFGLAGDVPIASAYAQ